MSERSEQALVTPIPQVEITPSESRNDGLGKVQHIYRFPNGYAGSVIQGPWTYGGDSGFWEIGVFWDDNLCYDTPITNDVLGWQSDAEVADVLAQIAALPPKPAKTSLPVLPCGCVPPCEGHHEDES